jgi:hypothetical protein
MRVTSAYLAYCLLRVSFLDQVREARGASMITLIPTNSFDEARPKGCSEKLKQQFQSRVEQRLVFEISNELAKLAYCEELTVGLQLNRRFGVPVAHPVIESQDRLHENRSQLIR